MNERTRDTWWAEREADIGFDRVCSTFWWAFIEADIEAHSDTIRSAVDVALRRLKREGWMVVIDPDFNPHDHPEPNYDPEW